MNHSEMLLYLAGKMSGIPQFGFPIFDTAANALRSQGYEVISPADLDRQAGFDGTSDKIPNGFLEQAMRRDIQALLRVDAVALLPGWETSNGVSIELTGAT